MVNNGGIFWTNAELQLGNYSFATKSIYKFGKFLNHKRLHNKKKLFLVIQEINIYLQLALRIEVI